MRKLSLIIAVAFLFGITNFALAQPGQGGGVPGHGGIDNPGHGGTPPWQSNGSGSTSGNDLDETSHDVNITIPTIALVDVEASDGEASSINLTPDVSALEAGEAVDFSTATNSDLWLNYTSVVGSEQTRNITVSISEGSLPSGVSLNLQAGGVSTGNGELGSSEDQISLSDTEGTLVTGIGSGYTESGYQKGRQLTYSLDMNNGSYATLGANNNYNVTVMFTITGEGD